MEEHDVYIAQFMGVVNSTQEQAEFYLEANNWNVEAALMSYYDQQEGAGAGAGARSGDTRGGVSTTATAGLDNRDDDPDIEDLDAIIARTAPPAASSSVSEGKRKAKEKSSTSGRKQGGVATFRDLSKSDDDIDDEDEDEDEDSQNYFAGGEASGVMVQGPPGRKDSNALIEDILSQAAKGGQRRAEVQEPVAPKKNYFTGTGNRLGSEGEGSTSVVSQEPESSTAAPEALETVTRTLTFWRNGYSLEDGPLMSYTDPANRDFLDQISSGYLNVRPGQPVEMRVAKRMDEDYKEPPRAPPKPFEGAGNRLGGITTGSSSSSTPGSFPERIAQSATPAPRRLEIDESQPVTSVQIRMADGTRMVARFNLTHTVNDIRGFINASRAGESTRSYVLQTNFPKKDLEDMQQTIKDAGLANAVVLQRYV
ncbi:hypothetical protein BGZ65_003570 [Modicella reniformis]|uniref:Uncharacterized protein n=1 Tax=Modicella reniformis TaxID=1440133 RepID=A0A9P6IL64_9FUNG|nr:hypothetical protein BGZ65_003570 [Modicella reniformis]